MGKDLDMWEIFVIIARHIHTYMNAEIFLLALLTIDDNLPDNSYLPVQMLLTKLKFFILEQEGFLV